MNCFLCEWESVKNNVLAKIVGEKLGRRCARCQVGQVCKHRPCYCLLEEGVVGLLVVVVGSWVRLVQGR